MSQSTKQTLPKKLNIIKKKFIKSKTIVLKTYPPVVAPAPFGQKKCVLDLPASATSVSSMNELQGYKSNPKGILNITRTTSQQFISPSASSSSNIQVVEYEDDNGNFDDIIEFSPESATEDSDCGDPIEANEIKKKLFQLIELNKAMSAKMVQNEAATNVLIQEFSKLSSTVKSLVLAITGQKVPGMDGIFPLKNMGDLQNVELLMQSSEDFPLKLTMFLKYLKSASSKDISIAFKEVVTDEFLEDYNWDGTKGQLALKKIKFFNTTLFDAWRNDQFTKDIYIDAVRTEIRKSHDRVTQRKNTTKRQSSQNVQSVTAKRTCTQNINDFDHLINLNAV